MERREAALARLSATCSRHVSVPRVEAASLTHRAGTRRGPGVLRHRSGSDFCVAGSTGPRTQTPSSLATSRVPGSSTPSIRYGKRCRFRPIRRRTAPGVKAQRSRRPALEKWSAATMHRFQPASHLKVDRRTWVMSIPGQPTTRRPNCHRPRQLTPEHRPPAPCLSRSRDPSSRPCIGSQCGEGVSPMTRAPGIEPVAVRERPGFHRQVTSFPPRTLLGSSYGARVLRCQRHFHRHTLPGESPGQPATKPDQTPTSGFWAREKWTWLALPRYTTCQSMPIWGPIRGVGPFVLDEFTLNRLPGGIGAIVLVFSPSPN